MKGKEEDKTFSFLLKLQTDREEAFAGFYAFAVRFLLYYPPAEIQNIDKDNKMDLIHDIVYHCVKDDFRVLKQYVKRANTNFAAWFYVTARNKCRDILKSKEYKYNGISYDNDCNDNVIRKLKSSNMSPEEEAELNEIIDLVETKISEMDEKCRKLLSLSAYGLKPIDIVAILRQPRSNNKKLSDEIRYCRKKLIDKLQEENVNILSILEQI